jgi:hypothetical protein
LKGTKLQGAVRELPKGHKVEESRQLITRSTKLKGSERKDHTKHKKKITKIYVRSHEHKGNITWSRKSKGSEREEPRRVVA